MTIAIDSITLIPFRDITNAGPAGSINSSVTDMARWLIVNSQKGKIAGRQIISPTVLADIHSPHMTTGTPQERPEIGPAGYGLGWGVDDYRGHRRAVHGGGIDGFSAMTTVFPQDGLGMVVLSNMNGTRLPEMLSRHAADRILSALTDRLERRVSQEEENGQGGDEVREDQENDCATSRNLAGPSSRGIYRPLRAPGIRRSPDRTA